jgi:hypothetical protein
MSGNLDASALDVEKIDTRFRPLSSVVYLDDPILVVPAGGLTTRITPDRICPGFGPVEMTVSDRHVHHTKVLSMLVIPGYVKETV